MQTSNDKVSSKIPTTASDSNTLEDTIDGVKLDIPDCDAVIDLDQHLEDIKVGHEELDNYREGALTSVAAINDAIEDAEASGDTQLVETLLDIRKVTFGLYARLCYDEDEIGDWKEAYDDLFDN